MYHHIIQPGAFLCKYEKLMTDARTIARFMLISETVLIRQTHHEVVATPDGTPGGHWTHCEAELSGALRENNGVLFSLAYFNVTPNERRLLPPP